jgi:hypothetical protein
MTRFAKCIRRLSFMPHCCPNVTCLGFYGVCRKQTALGTGTIPSAPDWAPVQHAGFFVFMLLKSLTSFRISSGPEASFSWKLYYH